ncbi:MAG: ABC transporter substrate-binding protein [Alphaproteobacteria bacterium]|nr:ABC transporter substrate-binding protein [Alphaproteobacteria bacterium]
MKKIQTMGGALLFFFCLASVGRAQTDNGNMPLRASLASIHGVINSPDEGPFVDLIKAIGAETGRTLSIEVVPMSRSIDNVIKGRADFHIPTIRNRLLDEASLPFSFTTESYGAVSFVIYSSNKKILTKKIITEALAKGEKTFPYILEVPASMERLFPFPCVPSNDTTNSLNKVLKGRVDALIWAQEDVDLILHKDKLKNIHRDHWEDLEDTIIIPKGEEEKETDRLLSGAIKKLRKSGKLKEIYSTVHQPFSPWQPADMGWE